MECMKKMRIPTLTVDPGIANTGWAEWSPDRKLLACGVIETSNKETLISRLHTITSRLHGASDIIVMEDFVGHLGKKTVMLLGAIYATQSHPCYRVHPRRWTGELFGRGHDSNYYKKSAEALASLSGLPFKTQHEADAISMLCWVALKNNLEGVYE